MAIGPKLNWIKSDFKDKFYMTIFLIISFLLSALIIKQFDINFLTKNSLEVEKNKKKAEVTRIVLIRKLISNCLIINADNKKDIIKNMLI